MIESWIQIEDGPIENARDKWGFIYMKSDNRTAPDEKAPDSTSYAEEAGEHQDQRRVYAAFDYTVEFLIDTPNRYFTSANAKIAEFNTAVREVQNGTDITKAKQITFYNDYKRVKIVGYPELIALPTDFYRDNNGNAWDAVQIELKIHVNNPKLCDFNYGQPETINLEDGGWIALESGGMILYEDL